MKNMLDQEIINDLVLYRIQRARDTIQEAIDVLEKDHFNASVNH